MFLHDFYHFQVNSSTEITLPFMDLGKLHSLLWILENYRVFHGCCKITLFFIDVGKLHSLSWMFGDDPAFMKTSKRCLDVFVLEFTWKRASLYEQAQNV